MPRNAPEAVRGRFWTFWGALLEVYGSQDRPGSTNATPGRGTGTPGIGPPKPDRAALLWADSRAVTLDPAHPARLWAARRHLWRPGDPWPDAVRWLLWRDGGGSMVAAFAPVADWTEAPPRRHPVCSSYTLPPMDRPGRVAAGPTSGITALRPPRWP